VVHIPAPPPPRRPKPIFKTIRTGAFLVRLFDPTTSFGQTALTFRRFGPLRRFDHQEPHAGQPASDPDRGIYYAAQTLSGCIVEVFGDTGLIACGEWHIARVWLVRPLTLLNISGRGAMRAGSVAALSKVPDHAVAQQWSRHFYEQPEYSQCDGIYYSNAHNDGPAFALYERAEDALDCPPGSVVRLDDPALRGELLRVAKLNHLICLP